MGCTLWPPWSTDTLLDIPSCTARGRLRLSPSLTPSDRSLPEHTLPALLPTADLPMEELLLTPPSLPSTITDTLDIPTSTARGRPSPSTGSSLTCTTLVLWPTLGSDTLW